MSSLNPPVTKRSKARRVMRLLSPCYYCDQPSETVDHLNPVSRGGSNDSINKVPCCLPCNQLKGSMNELEFIKFVMRLPEDHTTKMNLRHALINKVRRYG